MIKEAKANLLISLIVVLMVYAVQISQAHPHGVSVDKIRLDAKSRSEVVQAVGKLLIDNYIFLETAEKMRDLISSRLEEGKYNEVQDVDEFARLLTEDLQSISKDKHIRVRYDQELVKRIRIQNSQSEEDKEKAKIERIERERQQNFGYRKLEILDGNIGYLELLYFSGLEEAGPTAVAAMNFLANTDAVIIDLRGNGGGNPAMIQLISSYFLKEYTHLNSFEYRGESLLQQFWTLPYVPGRLMTDTDLYILVSRRTFSGAEEFTYNLKNLERATIIGETTGGGAHPGGFRIVDDGFLVWVPSGRAVNPITKTNWEGTGIEPHISISPEKALDKAKTVALENLMEKSDEEKNKKTLQWALDEIISRFEPVHVDKELLKKYVGRYTRGNVVLDNGTLYMEAGPRKLKMIPLSETYFILENESSIRVEFVSDDSGNTYEIIGHFRDGGSERVKRIDREN